MDDLKDRRYMHRVSIPSALLYFREIEKPFLLSTYQGPFQITDISKSSLSIEGPLRLESKTLLYLKIIVPDQPAIILKGQILGYPRDRAGNISRTVIQILPYGHDPHYNSFTSKKRLELCLSAYTP